MAPKSSSGRRKSGGKAQPPAQAAQREKTPEEILQSNIKVVERVAQKGLMHEGAIYYVGTPEERTAFYEAVDRAYKKLPEGYGYSFGEHSLLSGRKEVHIQPSVVRKREKYDYRTGKMKIVREKYSIRSERWSIGVRENSDSDVSQLLSQSALRGYAKAQVYKVAGLIYDPKTGGASAKYPALDSLGFRQP